MDSINKTMSKAEEISLLKELASGDSYFANAFTEQDINQMILNIENDWPLLLQTGVEHYSAIGQTYVRQQSSERLRQFMATLTVELVSGVRTLFVTVNYGEAAVTLEVVQNSKGTDYVTRLLSERKPIEHWSNWPGDYTTIIESFGRASFQDLIYANFFSIEIGTTIGRRY